ncbi:bifunctional phosphoglucose/phosphomannose isomerase [candidate division WOR-3 bacterium]|uniref:Bifunctional phosphoglucose/phosphomannose isomerase n=1 Tax=candidate division WOR-3 bacterium TaxID=2052148 RepID=A0A937XF67_UNCW3|nr:bifunctional phosphoglucose/phosphomannose isomerase [candidate division WOR-3 bacterium]
MMASLGDGTGRMVQLAMSLPEQLAAGAKAAGAARIGMAGGFDSVVAAGMGGSGIGAKIVQGLLLAECRLPVYVCNDYDLPAAVSEKALFVAVSYSGNTEETLSAYAQARRRGCRVIAITSGGELGRLAAAAGYPVMAVPVGMPPRAALGYLFSTLLVCLERLGVCANHQRDLDMAVRLMRNRRKSWSVRARTIAKHIGGRLPIVYSTSRMLDAVADRWRCQLNENAGVLCHTSSFPEHNHNEIVGIGRPKHPGRNVVVIALLDRETHPRTRYRLESVLDITEDAYYLAIRIEGEGRSRLARVFSLVMLGDLVSVELARLAGKDAMEIDRIDELKRRMAQKRG